MRRFFCPSENIDKENIVIKDSKELHHILDVLRLKINDAIIVFDGQGKEYAGTIGEIKKNQINIKISTENKLRDKKDVSITLACAIPKKRRFDYIVEKTTELGVDKIIPLKTERTIVSLSRERQDLKRDHWRQIAINASKQCGRSLIPEVVSVTRFSEVVSDIKDYDLCLFFCLSGKRRELKDVLKNFKEGRILIFIGPEGDFSEREIDLAKKAGCQFVCLGSRVLKVDTAAISVVSIINFLFSS